MLDVPIVADVHLDVIMFNILGNKYIQTFLFGDGAISLKLSDKPMFFFGGVKLLLQTVLDTALRVKVNKSLASSCSPRYFLQHL